MTRESQIQSLGRIVSVLALVLLAGQVGLWPGQPPEPDLQQIHVMNVHSTVTADGTLDTYQLQYHISSRQYETFSTHARAQGYDSFEAQLKAQYDPATYERITVNTTTEEHFVTIYQNATDYIINVTLTEWSPPANSSIQVTLNGTNVTYVDRFNRPTLEGHWPERSRAETIQVKRYTVTMPGDILASNGDSVNNRTAVWTAKDRDEVDLDYIEQNVDRISVTSRRPASARSGQGLPTSPGSGLPTSVGSGLPLSWMLAAGVAALVVAALLIGKRWGQRRQD